MANLSILIPARNEEWLQKTIEDILLHIEGDTEILVGHDGDEPNSKAFEEVIENDIYPVRRLFVNPNIGQRAMTNRLAKMSTAKYLMKCDAHCSFQQGFDVKMMAKMDSRTILAPYMGVLDPIGWTINGKKMTSKYCFRDNFVMVYDKENDEEDPETMCLQGSAWMIERENYWKWNVCDETVGSWGAQSVELGIAAWLNGGRCMTTKSAYYGHVFRHQDNEFPYDRGENPGRFATKELKRRYRNDPRILELAKKFGIDFASVV